MRAVGRVQRDRAGCCDSFDAVVVHGVGRHETETRVAMLVVVPVEEIAAVRASVLNATEALGDRTRARTALEASVALCREIGARYPEGYGLLGLGRLADEEGDAALALQLTQESLDVRRSMGHGEGIADTLIELGDLRARAGNEDAARKALDESVALSRDQGRKAQVALAQALLACLPGGDADAALAALGDLDEHGDSPRLRWLLFRATGDRAHLEEAKRLLDESLANVPEEYHESMLTNLRVNREIMAAWKTEFGDGDVPSEAETVVAD